MHRVAMLRLSASCTRSECTRTQWQQPLDDALSKCVLRPELVSQLSARTRPGALSTDRCCACNHSRAEISPFDLLVGDAAVCMSAGRPSFDSSLAMTQTTCAARAAVPTTLANSIGNCSALRSKSIYACSVCRFSIAVTVQWTS
jgi:hypothetical protein